VTDHGSCTDIVSLCPAFKCAGVNLSIGYYEAHTKSEYFKLFEWQETVNRVVKMLQDVPAQKFEFIEKKWGGCYNKGTKETGGTNSNFQNQKTGGKNTNEITGITDADLIRLNKIVAKIESVINKKKSASRRRQKEQMRLLNSHQSRY
jgi:hypothetical protein